MDIIKGYVYHIKDEYFAQANDPYLMKNRENGNARPTYYGFIDKNTNLLWMIPMSKQYEKYQETIKAKEEKYGRCLGIIIGNYGGNKSAFLLQNMFPITEKYIDHVHELKGQPIAVSEALQKEIAKCSMKLRALHKKGKKVIFPNINRLEEIMLNEMQQEQQHNTTQHIRDDKPMDTIAQLQQENLALKKENEALRSENAEIASKSQRQSTTIRTANAVLAANPELKKAFVEEKRKLLQQPTTSQKKPSPPVQPQQLKKGNKPKH